MEINFKFKMGYPVFIKTDPTQSEHIITGYTVRPGVILYCCKINDDESWHYDFELTDEPDMVKKTA